MMEFFENVNQAQATIVAALLTLLAAVIAVLLGGLVFGKRVSNLKDAMDESLNNANRGFNDHLDKLDTTLDDLADKSDNLGELVETIAGKINILESELPVNGENLMANEANQGAFGETDDNPLRTELKIEWEKIKGRIEDQIRIPKIHGKTRNRYLGMGRRNYADLIVAMERDGNLIGVVSDYQKANSIWQAHRTGKRTVDQQSLNAIKEIGLKIEGASREILGY